MKISVAVRYGRAGTRGVLDFRSAVEFHSERLPVSCNCDCHFGVSDSRNPDHPCNLRSALLELSDGRLYPLRGLASSWI
jgi:hypothetical protein